jgi:hypothetical protein
MADNLVALREQGTVEGFGYTVGHVYWNGNQGKPSSNKFLSGIANDTP